MKILFDAKSSQVQVQVETHSRLTELYDAIVARGWAWERSGLSGAPLAQSDFNGVDVLCILTRLHQTAPGTTNPFPAGTDFQYTPGEIALIQQFVSAGGGLLLISNHGPFPDKPNDDQTVNDRALAQAFGVRIAPACFKPLAGSLVMSGPALCPLPSVAPILHGVTSVEVHNCSAISAIGGITTPIVFLPSLGVVNVSPTNHDAPEGMVYALTLNWYKGKVIIAGNSGLAGNTGSNYPAAGLIDAASNRTFLLNCFQYLGTR